MEPVNLENRCRPFDWSKYSIHRYLRHDALSLLCGDIHEAHYRMPKDMVHILEASNQQYNVGDYFGSIRLASPRGEFRN